MQHPVQHSTFVENTAHLQTYRQQQHSTCAVFTLHLHVHERRDRKHAKTREQQQQGGWRGGGEVGLPGFRLLHKALVQENSKRKVQFPL